MSLNTYNKNIDIIWHYCIISQIKLHGFWKRSKDDIFMTTNLNIGYCNAERYKCPPNEQYKALVVWMKNSVRT